MSEKDGVAALIEHLDRRLDAQDTQRADEFRHVYDKLDEHSRETRKALQDFRAESTAAIGDLTLKIARHDLRIGAIEGKAQKSEDRAHDWSKTGATVVLGGGTIVAFWEWLKEQMK